jgi:hypothetical protein
MTAAAHQAAVDRAAVERKVTIRIRARFNLAVVAVNLFWESAWPEPDVFRPEQASLVGWLPRLIERDVIAIEEESANPVQPLLAFVAAIDNEFAAHRSSMPTVDALVTAMRPRVRLLEAGIVELDELLLGLRAGGDLDWIGPAVSRTEAVIDSLGQDPGVHYPAACIRARRYALLLLTYRRALRDTEGPAVEARAGSLSELGKAVAASPRLRVWSRRDPAFRHLLGEREFEMLTRPLGEGALLGG